MARNSNYFNIKVYLIYFSTRNIAIPHSPFCHHDLFDEGKHKPYILFCYVAKLSELLLKVIAKFFDVHCFR